MDANDCGYGENGGSAPEARALLDRVAALPKQPGVSLDPVLKPSVEKEAELRRLFAQDRKNYRLVNPYIGLVSVFEAPEEYNIRWTRTRAVKDEEDLCAKCVFSLPENRQQKDFEPCTDWNNVVASGGSVLGCLLPLDDADKESRRTIRKFYHSSARPTSNIDLFLWGLDVEKAEAKMNQIFFEAVRDSVPWDVTCVRTKHAVSIRSQYPYRSVQVVLRLYQSPAEILAGFDVDEACVAYDGSRILANPRSIAALALQANIVDMTRRSPSYEVRLAKYASRGFEVQAPDLRRADVDPTVSFFRTICLSRSFANSLGARSLSGRALNRITGLAHLLVLEKLSKPETRASYLESHRNLRSRAEEEIAGIELNDYEVARMHIPYGPGWTAQRIEKLIYQTDTGINSTFNPKNKDRQLLRHVAFFGTMKECLEDLTRYVDSNHSNETDHNRIPLLWSAIESNSKKVIDYLAGSGPLAAYQYYAKTKTIERAEALRLLQDLDKQLPKLLGIVGNRRGENALTTVILSAPQDEKLPLAKKILSLFPAQTYLQSTIALTGWASTHIAAAEDVKSAFFDFLSANGLSLELTDNKGCVHHVVSLCSAGGPDSDSLYSENGVGETVLETAWAEFLIDGTRNNYPGHDLLGHRNIRTLDSSSILTAPVLEDSNDLGTELELLKSVHTNLLRDGKLAANAKLKEALDAFFFYLSEKVRSEAESPDIPTKEETTDKCDPRRTFKVGSAAVSAIPLRRQLVHLTDVQRSVRASIAKAAKKPEPEIKNDCYRRHVFLKGDEIPEEAEAEAREKHEMWQGILGWSLRLRNLTLGDFSSRHDYCYLLSN
ncbi:hypothetical protein ACEPAF_660 [Sanghuangporus sanghuang]